MTFHFWLILDPLPSPCDIVHLRKKLALKFLSGKKKNTTCPIVFNKPFKLVFCLSKKNLSNLFQLLLLELKMTLQIMLTNFFHLNGMKKSITFFFSKI